MIRSDRNDPLEQDERDLEAWFAGSAPWRARSGLLDDVLQQTRTVRQVQGGGAWRLLRPDLARLLPRPLMVAIAWLLVVALAVGAIAAGSALLPTLIRQAVWTGFRPLPDVSAFGNRTVADVIPVDSGYVALGGVVNGSANVAASWSSSDGLRWSEAPGSVLFQDAVMARMARRGATIVMIGQPCSGGLTPLCDGARFAVSTDGSPWQAVPYPKDEASLGGNALDFASITATANAFVAVGVAGDKLADATTGAIVAWSTDGSNWMGLDPSLPEFAGRTMGAVAAGTGGLVAIGTDASLAPVVWTSTDGSAWALASGGRLPQGRLRDLAGGPRGYVAVGSDGTNAVAWASADGHDWTAAAASPVLADASMTRVFWTGTRFLALGATSSGDGAAWVSADGLAWTTLDTGVLFQRATITAAVVVGSRLELFGTGADGRLVTAISAP
jgi:hypothetical protein